MITVDKPISASQAERCLGTLRAFHDRLQRQREEKWAEHASKFPHLRIALSNHLDALWKAAQNARDMARAAGMYGPDVAERTGIPIAVQFARQLRLYRQHDVPPDSYYFLGMYDGEKLGAARFFLSDTFTSTILRSLASFAPDRASKPLRNKEAFWEHCRDIELPSVPVLAVVEQGRLRRLRDVSRDAPPPYDLFSKPVVGAIGQGAEKWLYNGDNSYTVPHGHTVTSEELIDALKQQSSEKTIILQPCIPDHPRLQELTGGKGPSTLRIITIRKLGGTAEHFGAFLTTPRKPVAAPTFTKGTALAARVSGSGRLGRLLTKSLSYFPDGQDTHPVTGKRMTDVKLPYWEQAKSIALRAHASLPGVACVGWDFLMPEGGPLLLEGNNDCSAALLQITHQQLLGQSRFPVYLSDYMDALA